MLFFSTSTALYLLTWALLRQNSTLSNHVKIGNMKRQILADEGDLQTVSEDYNERAGVFHHDLHLVQQNIVLIKLHRFSKTQFQGRHFNYRLEVIPSIV